MKWFTEKKDEGKIKCTSCKKLFLPTHKNKKFCSDDCYHKEKADREAIIYELVKDVRKGLYANYKIFVENLSEEGTGTCVINLDTALRKGFDEKAFYGSKDGWFFLDIYRFRVIDRKIELKKIV